MIDRKKIRDDAFLKDFIGPCPTCGYQLKNPSSNRCPECGSHLRVLLLAPFRFSPWHALLASVVISIGVILDRVVLTIVGISNSNGTQQAWEMFWMTAIPLVFLCAGFLFIWTQKRHFQSLALWKRVCWYIVAIVFPLIVTGLQLYYIVAVALGA